MTDSQPDSERFEALSRELLNRGLSVRFEARGASMSPCIRDGDIVHITPVIISKLRKGDIVLTKGDKGFLIHRLIVVDHDKDFFITRGDCGKQDDTPVNGSQILGIAVSKEIRFGRRIVRTKLTGFTGRLMRVVSQARSAAGRLLRRVGLRSQTQARPPAQVLTMPRRGKRKTFVSAIALLLAFAAPSVRAQVAVDTDASTSGSADLTGAGTQTLSFNHSTSTAANRALLVGVSMNITNSPTAAVTGITYNGTALTLVGAQNDSSNTRRVEQWYLLAPASGTSLPIVVSVNIPATATVGVTAGATVFTDVDQTVPLGTFASGDGESSGCIATSSAGNYQCNSQANASSVVNGMVFDTLAVGMGTITVEGPQVQQWNVTSGGTTPNASQDVIGTASSRTGAPAVPLAEGFNESLALTSVTGDAFGFNLTSVTFTTTGALTLSSVANASGGTTVYAGTITGGAGNALAGYTVVVTGFTGTKDNGTFTCTASTATTITLNNTAGVAQTQAATATATNAVYTGTITGGAGNAFSGDTVVVSGFVNAGNNGTFTATSSTATTLTLNNKAGITETDPGTATVKTGTSTVYTGTITGGIGNGFAGDSFTIAGFSNAANNGTFTCTASTATTLTCSNTAGVTATGTGTATTNSTFNWSEGATPVNPSVADIAVTTSVGTAVFLGQNTTYNITVTNNGTSAANSVVLTDTWPTTNLSTVSVTASSGTTCTAAPPPITCTLPTPLASGATATVAVVVDASASGAYANTASVTDSGTPPDPNTGNNSFTAVATVQSAACANVAQAAPASSPLTGVLNTYYPGSASVSAGTKSITIGTATGGPGGTPTAIAAGNLLLVIQMQDASISTSNTVAYGNNSTGQGFTALNNAGNYEFVTATNSVGVTGGTLTVTGAGGGGGLVFGYDDSAETATKGQSTFQVVLVPQYTTATLATAGLTAGAWNGSTGGVLVLDTSSTLTLNGATVVMDGMGFRGGAGLQMSGTPATPPNPLPASTDFVQTAPATYTPTATGSGEDTAQTGWDGAKGEGIAGTPAWVESDQTYLATGTGYPSGTSGTDGSMGRGAPGNAGGGGTDADPATETEGGNDQNTGGGGGGNGGNGGFGGDSWDTNLSTGGEGGVAFPATINRVALGGGGGAGTRNNSNGLLQASAGAAGGGIIIIRTYALSGSATLTANGISAYNGTLNDGGGGGGAGGSVVILSANGGESGLSLQANGGIGGNAWGIEGYTMGNRHGPGGGGGGGVVLVSGTPASVSVSGGTNGTTETPGVPYGSTPGTAGFSVTNASITQTSGTQSGAECTPDMTVSKTHVGNFTRGSNASYTVTASNISPYGSTDAIVTLNDTLPIGLTPTSASGTGWSCSIDALTVSCTDGTVLPGVSSYPPITINALVAQTAPSTVTNTAIVGGGGEINLTNDTSTNVASVVSVADLAITNADSPDPVAAGSNVTYTQVVTNNGPSAADNAALVESIPTNTTFVSIAAPTGWTCFTPAVGATGSVLCTDLNMAGSTSATFSLVVAVNTGTANGTVITDTATVSSAVTDPNTANNTASAFTVVGATSQGQMTVTNVASPNPVIAGNNITYTQIATNVGSGTANNPTLTENTPTNTVFESISAPTGTTCTTPAVGSAGAISCSGAAAPAGLSGTVVLVVQVNAGTASGTTITDTVTVNSTNQAFGANSATATDLVATSTQADLALATVATPATVIAGNDITYTQTVTNNGPASASNVSFTEAIPTNTTSVSVSAPVGWSCTTTTSVVCTVSSLAANASADIIVVVNVAPTIAAGTITANSSVSATTSDPNSTNNSTIVTTPVVDKCNLGVTDSGTPNPVLAGGDITYSQIVTNPGPSNCTAGTFSELTPSKTTFVSVSVVTTGGGTWTCPNAAPVACTNPSVPPGSTATITAVYQVIAGTAAGTLINDTANVASSTYDTNPANDSATVTIAVASATQSDVSVTNSGSPNPVSAGQNITYSQTVMNAGPAAASSTITLTETLPANTSFVSLSGPAGWTCTSAAPYTCSIASLAVNASANFTFVVTVNTTVASGSTIADTASVTCLASDPNCANNTASATVYVGSSADLSITNTASPVPVQAGNNITYTQVVTNAGPSVAAAATLTQNTPANTTFQSITIPSGWSCTYPTVGGTGAINCSNASFAVGSASFTIVVAVTSSTTAGTAINDTATVSTTTNDPNIGNNTATAADVVALSTQADLVAANSASPTSVSAGSNITYTQSVTNDGPAAAAASSTFTQSTPPNTTFQSITAPTGWTCVTPAVGATGTITCTDSGTLAANAVASFSLALQVSSTTPSGTNIADTVTANATNIVPNLTTNSATSTVVVANANSADMAIVKTASPNSSVAEGDPLTYTLTVTNNGPASATDVTVTDPLPSAVTYLSATTTAGTCSEAGGTVTCLLGTMPSTGTASTATVTILTMAAAMGTATNTASVVADQTDPNPGNNSSTQTETITAATAIRLQSFSARMIKGKTGKPQVALFWKTGGEAHNLGFNVYREQSGQRVRMNPSLIAGSALVMTGSLPKHAGKSYAWIDSSTGSGDSSYWLEDVDVNGARVMHGPVTPEAAATSPSSTATETIPAAALMFSQLNQSQPAAAGGQRSHFAENTLRDLQPTTARRQKQFELASQPAVKIYVTHEGWYQVTQPELINAGLDPNVDPWLLHLYAEAVELPIQITGVSGGAFGPQAAIEFYGTGIDTPYSGTRVYWLVAEQTPGLRIPVLQPSSGPNQPPASFPASVELTPHTTYFSALITSDGNNFFGPLVSTTPVDQTIQTPTLDLSSTDAAKIEVVLQGIVLGYPHDVAIVLNGSTLGNLSFTGQVKGTFSVALPQGLLQSGANTVTLTAQNGEYDTSLLQSIRITYPHSYVADSDVLQFAAPSGDEVSVAGFSSAPAVVLDISDPNQPVELTPQIATDSASNPPQYALAVQIPFSTATASSPARHTLLTVGTDQVATPAAIYPNTPSHWHSAQRGGEIVMVSYAGFASALTPVVQAHAAQGQSAVVVPVDELYDEFTFGEHSPYAIRDFLRTAGKAWTTPPHYLLLNGRASLDPRNYLGFGFLDFVPTKIVPTSMLMTASDDWFSENSSGMPTIATGRFPVSTSAEAALVAGKVATYEGPSAPSAWTSQALMVADVNDTENFTQDSEIVQAQLPSAIHPTDVFATNLTIPEAQQDILTAINSGQVLVNYAGHGSEDEWSGDDLFDNTAANGLTNGSSLPVFLIMDCLNGFFQDVYDEPLAVTLMLAPNGGAVAVLASSGLNQAPPQTNLDKLVVQNAFGASSPALGDAILKAKSAINDVGVRKTFNLMGDPAMPIKQSSQTAAQ
jgi:uncharacterized repeat protein (TIGR01451 family)